MHLCLISKSLTQGPLRHRYNWTNGMLLYVFYWLTLDSHAPKSKTRVVKVEKVIHQWKRKTDKVTGHESCQITDTGDLSTRHWSFSRPDKS